MSRDMVFGAITVLRKAIRILLKIFKIIRKFKKNIP